MNKNQNGLEQLETLKIIHPLTWWNGLSETGTNKGVTKLTPGPTRESISRA